MQFQGLPARICWLGYGERHLAGLRFNEMVASGELSAPVVIGRDHLDSGSVASPYRETEAMLDGSDAIADWPLLNALLNTASGATWVSIHSRRRRRHRPVGARRPGLRRRRHRARRGEARAGAHQRPGHRRRPARRRGLRAGRRGGPRARRAPADAGVSASTRRSFDELWAELAPLGRRADGGYDRSAWTPVDAELRAWFRRAGRSGSAWTSRPTATATSGPGGARPARAPS